MKFKPGDGIKAFHVFLREYRNIRVVIESISRLEGHADETVNEIAEECAFITDRLPALGR